jgi:hypothetical protein
VRVGKVTDPPKGLFFLAFIELVDLDATKAPARKLIRAAVQSPKIPIRPNTVRRFEQGSADGHNAQSVNVVWDTGLPRLAMQARFCDTTAFGRQVTAGRESRRKMQ